MVVGTPRSGTTLVQRYVTEECGLRSGPETHFFTEFPSIFQRHSRRIGERERLRAALLEYSRLPQLEGAGLDIDRLLESLAPDPVHLYSVFEAVVSQLAGGGKELCEKTPGHLWWWDRLTRHDVCLKLVVVVRDPRAVVSSLRSAQFTERDISVLSQWWETDQRMAAAATRRLGPTRCHVVRYEDAVEREEEVRSRLASFHRRTLESETSSYPVTAPPLVLPWETWKLGYNEPTARDRIDRWRSVLTDRDIETTERVCRREMARLGYQPQSLASRPELAAKQQLARLRHRLAVAFRRQQQRRVTL